MEKFIWLVDRNNFSILKFKENDYWEGDSVTHLRFETYEEAADAAVSWAEQAVTNAKQRLKEVKEEHGL